MNYTPRNPRLLATPDRVRLCQTLAREFASGVAMGPLKRRKIAPSWMVEEVKKDMLDQGLLSSRNQHPVFIYKRKPAEIDRASIQRRADKTLSYDFRDVSRETATPDELAERRRRMAADGWTRPAA